MRSGERRRATSAPDRAASDDGFLLLESVVAITVITVVMSALTALLVTVTQTTSHQRDEQVAASLAVSGLDRVRAIGAAGAVSGRDATSSNAQLTHTPATADYPATASFVAPWLTAMTPATDTSAAAGSGANAAVPTVAVHQTLNGLTFSVSYFVGYCWLTPGASSADCVKTTSSGAVQYVRVVVAVVWTGGRCGVELCDYVSATLLDGTGDPVFNFNQTPPAAPVPNTVPTQVNAVGDTVQGISGVSGCASPCPISATGGVPPMIFSATGLPPGLSMDTNGLVTGTPTKTGSYAVTVSVTDAFLNSASTSFTWTIGTPLTFDAVAAQSNKAGDSVTLRMTGASGGTGSGYTWTATGLPPGLAINASSGLVSGTIKATAGSANPYQVTVTLADSSGVSKTSHSFAWTVTRIPLALVAPADQTSTVNRAIGTLDLSGSIAGGSGSVVWSDPGHTLPAGLSITADGQGVTGTPTSTVSRASVTLQARDTVTGETQTTSFAWSVVAAPTVTKPSTMPGTSVGSTVSAAATYTCADAPCSFTATGLPPGISITSTTGTTSGSIVLSGTVTGSSGSFSATVTATDKAGGTGTASFTWTVKKAPTLTNPGSPSTQHSTTATRTLSLTSTCDLGGCTFTAKQSSGAALPSWLSINPSTGTLSAVKPPKGSVTITVTITDPAGSSASQTFTWKFT